MTKLKLKEALQENKLLTSFSIFFVFTFVFLGIWQIERAAHKESLLQAFNSEQESPPARLTNNSPIWSRVFFCCNFYYSSVHEYSAQIQ